LRAAAHDLLGSRDSGRPVDFSSVIRRAKAEHHFLYFRRDGQDIVLLRILHEKMDARRHLP
jgi:plasmid stabilization system protein ParE